MDRDSKVIILPHTPAMVNEVELWLENKTKQGWRLINKKFWVFRFISCKPYVSKYFIYKGFDSGKGISFDYHMAREKYGKAKSLLNKENMPIFEVDVNKLDATYCEYINLRNQFYTKHYLKLLLLSGFFLAVATALAAIKLLMIVFVAIWLALLLYAMGSLVILRWHKKKPV